MASDIGIGVIMGRIVLARAECCGALFQDTKEAEEHEAEHQFIKLGMSRNGDYVRWLLG